MKLINNKKYNEKYPINFVKDNIDPINFKYKFVILLDIINEDEEID